MKVKSTTITGRVEVALKKAVQKYCENWSKQHWGKRYTQSQFVGQAVEEKMEREKSQ